MTTTARVRAASYITRTGRQGPELLVFRYPTAPQAGTHLPGGGVEPGERPDAAAIREAVEETGIQGSLDLHGVVGVQQGTYDTGDPCISIYFHLVTDEPRNAWTHTMVGDDAAWDTGLQVHCHFAPLAEAAELLRTSWHHQEEYIGSLYPTQTSDGLPVHDEPLLVNTFRRPLGYPT
jgi:8-oxo-dGTP pyrophosphatase MutT (NUDIX family)